MSIETPGKVDDRIQTEASRIAYRQIITAKKISRKAKIAETFDLTEAQMAVYNTAFALYLETKGKYELSYLANRPEMGALQKIPILKLVANQVMQGAERNELTVKILRKSIKDQSSYFQGEGVGPRRLVNSANYLSTKYLEDSDRFSDQVMSWQAHVEKILRD